MDNGFSSFQCKKVTEFRNVAQMKISCFKPGFQTLDRHKNQLSDPSDYMKTKFSQWQRQNQVLFQDRSDLGDYMETGLLWLLASYGDSSHKNHVFINVKAKTNETKKERLGH